jgi:adenosyl cobinamide kinase/adenosyl cobinamide phosphate guanylyltransferase
MSKTFCKFKQINSIVKQKPNKFVVITIVNTNVENFLQLQRSFVIKQRTNELLVLATITTYVKNLLQFGTNKLCNQEKTKQAINFSNNHHICQKPLTTWNKKAS